MADKSSRRRAGRREKAAVAWALAASALLLLAPAAPVHAAPPPDADPALAPWFQGLRGPDTGVSCCSVSDCRPVEARTNGDRYEVLIEGRWVAVPSEKVLRRTDNPTGRAVVCWTPMRGIMCFVHGPEA